MDDYCDDCEAPLDVCYCGEDPAEYPEEPPDPGDYDDYLLEREEHEAMNRTWGDYWQNDAGEWRLG